MDKVAIISDVHGNLEALKTVLDDINKRSIKYIYFLGDIVAKGSHQKECIKLIKKSCYVILQGNCDKYFSSDLDLDKKSEKEKNRILWNKEKIGQENMNYLLSLPFCYEFYMSGRLIRLFHASPKKNDFFVGNIDLIDRLYEQFLPSDRTVSQCVADVVIYGHMHTQFYQKIYNRILINAGSVGNAIDVFRNDNKDGNNLNTSVANYLIVSGKLNSHSYDDYIDFNLISIPYNIDEELKDNIGPEHDDYELEIRKGKYRDMEKIYKSFELRGIDKDKI